MYLVVVMACILIAIDAFLALRGKGEYILQVTLSGTVIITRTDNGMMGGPFPLKEKVPSGSYILGKDDDKEIYNVQFIDITRRPGRFTISIGESIIDIMPARIIFDNVETQWKRKGSPRKGSVL